MAVALDLTTFVTNAGVPVTGLAGANIPEIEIWTTAGAVIQASTDTTEAAGGFYIFNFTPTAGVNYIALFDHDPAAAGQVTAQERYNSISFSEFIDDIVPEGGTEDYGVKLQRLDAAVTTRAAPGAAMDLVANAVDAASVAVGAIEADAFAAGAIDAAAIANGAIDAATFAAGAIDAAAIANGAIDAATFAAGAIDAAAIANGAIDAATFAANAIDAAAIAPGAIDAATFAAGAIDAAAIATDAIGSAELATSAVNEIRDSILDDAIRFSGGDIDVAISTRNSVVPMLGTLSQTEHDQTQTDIAALNDLDAAAVEDAVWDATRASHTDVGSFGQFTGDATMRGTDGANTVVPMTAALSQTEHDATQTAIAALTDIDASGVEDAVWDAVRASHTDVGSFGQFTGDATMRGTDGANTTTPMTAALSQTEHDATQTAVAALNDLDATGVEDAVWDATRASHTDVGSFGQFTGDATMRGTDGANTVIPMLGTLSQTEHDATQTDIANLNDPTVAAIADGVLDEALDEHVVAGSTGAGIARLFGRNTRTKLFFAVNPITGGREIPINAVSHMEVDVQDEGGSFPGVVYFVVFNYLSTDTNVDSPRSSDIQTSAPTDGSFTSVAYPPAS